MTEQHQETAAAKGSGLDLGALGEELAQAIPGFGALESATKFSDGQSNPTYLLTAGTQALCPAGQAARAAFGLRPSGRPRVSGVEGVVWQCRSGAGGALSFARAIVHRADVYVMSHVDGRILWDPALPEETVEGRRAIYDAMNRVLAALHSVGINAVGLSDFGKPGSYFERQIGRWAKQYRASETEKLEDMDWLIDWLEKHDAGDDGQVALVHGDYRIDNMIFSHGGADVLAVLDWELSTLGHPLADLAYQCMQWRLPNRGNFRGNRRLDREALGLPLEADYVRLYCERRGNRGPAKRVICACLFLLPHRRDHPGRRQACARRQRLQSGKGPPAGRGRAACGAHGTRSREQGRMTMKQFEGLTVLITGATGGFGEAAAERFYREGANLVLSDLTEDGVDRIASRFDSARVATLAGSVADEKLSEIWFSWRSTRLVRWMWPSTTPASRIRF